MRLLIIFSIIMSFATLKAEPKFRYIDSEHKDKPKSEVPKPKRPAYYDNFKKLAEQPPAEKKELEKVSEKLVEAPKEKPSEPKPLPKEMTNPPSESL